MDERKDGGQRLGVGCSLLRVQAHRVALPYAVQQGPDRTARGPPVWQKEPAPYPGLSCACRSRAVTLSEAEHPSRALARSSARPRAHPCHRDVGHAGWSSLRRTRSTAYVVRSAAACAPHAGLGRERVRGRRGRWPSRLRRPWWKEGQVGIVPVACAIPGDRGLAMGVLLPRNARSALGSVHRPVPSSALAISGKKSMHLALVVVGRPFVHRCGKALFA